MSTRLAVAVGEAALKGILESAVCASLDPGRVKRLLDCFLKMSLSMCLLQLRTFRPTSINTEAGILLNVGLFVLGRKSSRNA